MLSLNKIKNKTGNVKFLAKKGLDFLIVITLNQNGLFEND